MNRIQIITLTFLFCLYDIDSYCQIDTIPPQIARKEVFTFETRSIIDDTFVDGSLACADYDSDGDQDLIVSGSYNIYLFQNIDDSLVRVPNLPFESIRDGSLSWADYDNDGDQDILITGESSEDAIIKLYQYNSLTNEFIEVFENLFNAIRGTTADWADYDNDGDQDVIIAGEGESFYGSAILYENVNGEEFIKVQNAPFEGVTDASVDWADYDNDGDQDLAITGIYDGYVYDPVNGTDYIYDYITTLYRNSGNKTFTKVISTPFVGVRKGSLAWADYNNDGYKDLMIVGGGMDIHQAKLYQYDYSSDTFSEVFPGTFRGMYESDIEWSDYNQDGYQDIILTGGDNKGQYAKLYKNIQGNGFEEVEDTPFEGVYRGATGWADFNNDGYPDLVIAGTSDTCKLYMTRLNQEKLLDPINLEKSVDINVSFSFTLNENVQKGSGNIYFKNFHDDSIFETINIESEKVIVNGQTVSFTLDTDLIGESVYYITIDSGALTDLSGNEFEGINSKDIWSFATKPYSIPSLKITSSAVSPTNYKTFPLTFKFSEQVSGFEASDILVENGAVHDLQTLDSIHFNANIISASEGNVVIQVLAGAAVSSKNVDNIGATFHLEYNSEESSQAFGSYNKVYPADVEASDYFGHAVSISQNFAIIGSSHDNDNGYESGAAYIFKKDNKGNWKEHQKLLPNDGDISDRFGSSVSISGNYAIVGASLKDGAVINAGAAYIFEKDNEGIWQQVQKLISPDAVDPESNGFGREVLITDTYAMVNCRTENGQVVYISKRDVNGVWQHSQTLSSPSQSNSSFGGAFSISGNYLLVGSTSDNAAYIYKKNEVGIWEYKQLLVSSDPSVTNFGRHLSLSGETAIICSNWLSGDNQTGGRAFIFELSESGNWYKKQVLVQSDEEYKNYFGSSVSFSDDFGIITNIRNYVAYIYKKDSVGMWQEKQKLYTPDGYSGSLFGGAVATSDQIFVLGNYADGDKGNNAGTAYFFEVEEPKVNLLISSAEVISDNQSTFQTTFTFSKKVKDFDISDINITNGILSNLTTEDSITFVIPISPINEGDIKLHINADVAFDMADKGNKATYAIFSYDPNVPTVVGFKRLILDTISNTYKLDIIFNKQVNSFSKENISINNGSVINLQTLDSITFQATILPETEGEISITIPENTVHDKAGRANKTAGECLIEHDLTAPTIEFDYNVSAITNNPDIALTITFSEKISEFWANDIKLNNAILKSMQTLDSITFEAEIRPIENGLITISIPANAVYDKVINYNKPSDEVKIYFDNRAPVVTITSQNQNFTNGLIAATITFSEEVKDFDISDILVDNGSVAELTTLDSVIFNVNIFPVTEGKVTIVIENNTVIDLAGNFNFAALPLIIEYDITSPELVISGENLNITNKDTVLIDFTFSEKVIGFGIENINVSNGSINEIHTTDSTKFIGALVLETEGNVIVSLDSNIVKDVADNSNKSISTFSFLYDPAAPEVEVTSIVNNITNEPFVPVSIIFDEPVVGFNSDKISIENGQITNLQTTDSAHFSAHISPVSEGIITVEILADMIQDLAGNKNKASNQYKITYDKTAPVGSMSDDIGKYVKTRDIILTISFNEPVKDFTNNDIHLSNGIVQSLLTNDSINFSAEISFITEGMADIEIPAGTVYDFAGNENTSSNQLSIYYDAINPSVSLSSTEKDTTHSTSFFITVSYDEWVTDFTKEDIEVSNAVVANMITTDSISFFAEVSPVMEGTVTLKIPSNIANDLAGNGNMASEAFSIVYTSKVDSTKTDSFYNLNIAITTLNSSVIPEFIAILYQIQEGKFTTIATKEVTDASFITFDELQAGKYTVGVQPLDTSFLPVYLGNVPILIEARVIELSQDSIQYITVLDKPITQPKGTSIISGTLWQSEETNNGRILSGNALKTGEAVTDVSVYLMHPETHEILAYTVTDSQGGFSFTGLHAGYYLFIADYNGLPNDEQQNLIYVETDFETVTITAIVGANIRVIDIYSEKQVTGVEEEKSHPAAIRYYPNPVVNELQIELPSIWIEGLVRVTDPSGKLLQTQKILATTINLNLETRRAGIYIVTISKGEKYHTFKIQKQ